MTLSPDRLSANFKEIYFDALDNGESLNLVPSLFSDQLYAAKSWMGRIWRVIHAIIGFFSGNTLKTKLNALLIKLEASFEQFQKEIEPIFLRYQTLIAEISEGYEVDKAVFHNIRYQINKWNDCTRPFLKLVNQKQGEKIKNAFKEALPSLEKSILFDPIILQGAISYKSVINLEQMHGEDIPYATLSKLAMQKKLMRKEETEILDWIKWIESDTTFKQRKLHKVLKILILSFKRFNTSHVSKKPSIANLEIALKHKGLKTILKEDPKHLKWREEVRKEGIVTINGKLYNLGPEIINPKQEFDKNLVFICKDDIERVIVIGKNLSTLRIRRKGQKTTASGIKSPKWIQIDKDGRAGLQEKLIRHISVVDWQCNIKQDVPFLRPFIGFIKFMKQINKSPKDICYENIYFNSKGKLSAVKPTFFYEFNYALLEKLAFQGAKEIPLIFKHIIHDSTLLEHAHARYFEDIIASFQKEDNLEAQSIASLTKHAITTTSAVDAGILLHKDVRTLYHEINEQIFKNYFFDDEEKDLLKTKIRSLIQQVYLESLARSFLYPKSKDLIIQNFMKDVNLKSNKNKDLNFFDI